MRFWRENPANLDKDVYEEGKKCESDKRSTYNDWDDNGNLDNVEQVEEGVGTVVNGPAESIIKVNARENPRRYNHQGTTCQVREESSETGRISNGGICTHLSLFKVSSLE